MEDLVVYMGRKVPRKHFRAFIYGTDNQKKLVNSWSELQKHVQTGLWATQPFPEIEPEKAPAVVAEVAAVASVEEAKELVTGPEKETKKKK